jgi:hypothetical protein
MGGNGPDMLHGVAWDAILREVLQPLSARMIYSIAMLHYVASG